MITYQPDMKLELWVMDTGEHDTFEVYVNGFHAHFSASQGLEKFPIQPPPHPLDIVVRFGGADGGVSAIVDNLGQPDPPIVEQCSGTEHTYSIRCA